MTDKDQGRGNDERLKKEMKNFLKRFGGFKKSITFAAAFRVKHGSRKLNDKASGI